jgi:hypothetical protein
MLFFAGLFLYCDIAGMYREVFVDYLTLLTFAAWFCMLFAHADTLHQHQTEFWERPYDFAALPFFVTGEYRHGVPFFDM